MSVWRERINRELAMAETARAKGNEGMARVCARRAAGWTLQAYLKQRGIDLKSPSALDHFACALKLEGLSPAVKEILEHMRQAKVPDEAGGESSWPQNLDLTADARQLLSELFPGGT